MKIKAIYDNGGKTFDRYTVVSALPYNHTLWECLGLSQDGFSFSQWSGCQLGSHLGKRVVFDLLPEQVQKGILSRGFSKPNK
jgi:hypothetical protein